MLEHESETAEATVSPAPSPTAVRPLAEPARVTRQATLARALAAGAPVSNRGGVRVLAREDSDLGIVDPWAADRYPTTATAAPDPAGVPSTPAGELGAYFRAEIITSCSAGSRSTSSSTPRGSRRSDRRPERRLRQPQAD